MKPIILMALLVLMATTAFAQEQISWQIVFDEGSTVTLGANGEVNTAYAGSQFDLRSVNVLSAPANGGLLVEFEIPSSGRMAVDVIVYPVDSYPASYSEGFGWFNRQHRLRNNDSVFENMVFMQPESFSEILSAPGMDYGNPYVPMVKFKAGDRYGILIKPNGSVEYHRNYREGNDPIHVDYRPARTDISYRVAVNQGYTPSFNTNGGGLRNPQWQSLGLVDSPEPIVERRKSRITSEQ